MRYFVILVALVAGFVLMYNWVNMFNLVINAASKIKLQMYGWIIGAIIKIPLAFSWP